MKQLWFFLSLMLIVLLNGCDSHPIPSNTSNAVEGITTRGINPTTSLPVGSKALFHMSEESNIENPVFTFDGNRWEGESIFQQSGTLTALYPAYNEEQFITENPYSNGQLEDILIAQSCFNSSDIHLKFNHLFSMLTIHLLSPLKQSISYISLTTPQIEKLNADGSFTLSGTHTIIPDIDKTTGDYTFIIPPQENCPLTLTLIINGETISHPLSHTFVSGYKYECNVNDRKTPGIKNAEELIIFSKLINGGSDTKYSLSDFGERQADGKMLYRLLNDIDCIEIEYLDLNPIGYKENQPFKDIFDGNGKTISNFTAHPFYGVAGLFGRVSTNGIIKDLNLKNCSIMYISENSNSDIGFISAISSGMIINCSITQGNISTPTNDYKVGGLVGDARTGSKLINCFVTNTIISSKGRIGSFTGIITKGDIINCYSASNEITRKGDYECGGFCGKATESNIINCYNYNLTFTVSKKRGQFIGTGENSFINNCFYDNTLTLIAEDTNCEKLSNYKYNPNESNITEILRQRLNQWITDNQPSYDYTFTPWTEDKTGTLPAIFVP